MARETTLSCTGCEAAGSSSGTIISCSVLWSCSAILLQGVQVNSANDHFLICKVGSYTRLSSPTEGMAAWE